MPLQNRVTPAGEIVASRARGLMMGNRGGRIHTPARTLGTRRWASRQWICCVLEFNGRQREVMGQSYTELFFLDEVTALAAGHRPCFECRRAAAIAFAKAFPGEGRSRAPDMDLQLHAERLAEPETLGVGGLPLGAMVLIGVQPHALTAKGALPWTPEGYGAAVPRPQGAIKVLTPSSIRTVLSAGYAPVWHPSAGQDDWRAAKV